MAAKKSIWIGDNGRDAILRAKRSDIAKIKKAIIHLIETYEAFDRAFAAFTVTIHPITVPKRYVITPRPPKKNK